MRWLFVAAALLSAVELFLVQPMLGKQVLAGFGGAPAVWTTCLLFFQTALLLGYLYAHCLQRLSIARSVSVHGLVLLAAALVPPAGPDGSLATAGGSPAGGLLQHLMVSAALPFVAIAANAPLLQHWFAATTERRAADPYFLYAASNLGSLAALAGYPSVIEPLVPVSDQLRLWAMGIGALAALVVACGIAASWSAARTGPGGTAGAGAPPAGAGAALTIRRRLRWLLLAFTPSTLLAGVTAFLTADVAPVPLLWVVPLGLYLLSFAIAFGGQGIALGRIVAALPWLILPLTVQMTALAVWWTGVFHLAAFFAVALACHGALAADRPAAGKLTEFYVWLGVGGALGGLGNALVAPLAFASLAEYPLALLLALLLTSAVTARQPARPAPWQRLPGWAASDAATVLFAALAGGACWLLRGGAPLSEALTRLLLFSLPAMIGLALLRLPFWPGLALGLVLLVALADADAGRETLHSERSFFGVHRVVADRPAQVHRLMHGGTYHGGQSLVPERRCQPLAYAFPTGPVGQIFTARPQRGGAVAVVGLGAGAMVCYREPGEHFVFFEIGPAVARIARDPELFTYLSDCAGGGYSIRIGDGRRLLAQADERYQMIFLDAFTSDAVPVHLLTREALHVYLSRLADDGWLVFNITNRFLAFEHVVASLASDAGLSGAANRDVALAPAERQSGKMPSHYVVLARNARLLAPLIQQPGWRMLPPSAERPWTDDHSSVWRALKW